MAKSLTKETADKLLGNVPSDKVFWLCDGQTLQNLGDLDRVLKGMKKEVFQHHVTKDKNDFKNWVNDIVGDTELAAKLDKAKTKSAITKAVKSRINELVKATKKPVTI